MHGVSQFHHEIKVAKTLFGVADFRQGVESGFLNTVHKKPLRETTNPRQAATIVKVLVAIPQNALQLNLNRIPRGHLT
jgi:hypothetical protein